MHEWLAEVLGTSGKAVLLVTHDVDEAVLLSDRVHVMTPRPGTVRATVEVEIPRPRTRATTTLPRFVELKARLLDLLAGLEEQPA